MSSAENTQKSTSADKPPENSTSCLLVIVGREVGKQFFLNKDQIKIGRMEELEVSIFDAKVSREHAIIERVFNKEAKKTLYYLIDLDSTNGTFVNNRRITKILLQPDDKIVFGDTVLRFVHTDDETVEQSRLYRLAVTDSLTGLLNRSFFYQELTKEFSRAKNFERKLSLIILDVDGFKQINDVYGHQTGDLVLREISFQIMDVIRHQDSAARYGGEEFAIILPETSLEDAEKIANQIRSRIEKYTFDCAEDLKITVSGGVATNVEAIDEVDELIFAADMALFHAKKEFRAQITCATDDIIGRTKGFISSKLTSI